MLNNPNSFTVHERVILHLNRFSSLQSHYLIPGTITQDGIASAVGIARNHVPRAISSLKGRGLLIENKARVEGFDRKKKVYFLSERGRGKARELKEMQSIMKERLADIPTVPNFVGRENDLNNISSHFKSRKKAVFLVGESGIGKTYLAAKYANEAVKKKDVFWYSLTEGEGLKPLLKDMAEFLSRRGNGFLNYLINSNKLQIDNDGIIDSLKDIVKNSLFVIDDVELAGKETIDFLNCLIGRIGEFKELNIMLVGKNIGPFEGNNVLTIELEGLGREAILLLLGEENPEEIERIQDITKGHPLFLKAIQSTEKSGNSLDDVLEHGLLKDLTEAEKKLMNALSINDEPAHIDILFLEAGPDYQDVVNLVEKDIIRKVGEEMYDTHDIFKSFFISKISASQSIKLHVKASKILTDQGSVDSWIGAQSHLLKAYKHKDCAKAVVEKGLSIIRKGSAEEVGYIVENIDESHLEEVLWAELLLLKGYLLKLKGKWEEAIEEYEAALIIFKEAGLQNKMADAHAKIGRVYFETGKYDEAMALFETGLSLLNDEDDSVGARIYDEICQVHLRKGEIDEAEISINRALGIAEKISDVEMMARVNNTLGNIYLKKRMWEEAEICFRKCLDGLEGKDESMTVIAINNLAITKYRTGKIEKAIEHWEEAAQKAESMKSLNVMLTFANLGFMHFTTGNWKKAEYYCKKTLEISEPVKKDVFTSAALTVLGDIDIHRGNGKDAEAKYEKALEMRKKLGDKNGMAASHNDIAFVLTMLGNHKDARIHANEARKICEEIENEEQLLRSYLNAARIDAMTGGMGNSKENLRKCLNLSKNADNQVLTGMIYRDIGRVSHLEKEFFVAERYLKESVEILEKAMMPLELAYSLYEYAMVLENVETDAPESYMERSKEIFSSLGMPDKPFVMEKLGKAMVTG